MNYNYYNSFWLLLGNKLTGDMNDAPGYAEGYVRQHEGKR